MSVGQAANLPKSLGQFSDQIKSNLLLSLDTGIAGMITGINTQNTGVLKKIMAMGLLPGMPVKVIRKSPSLVFKIGNTTMAIDHTIAQYIEVQRLAP